MDHDQRFKTLIREFFADFMRLFFADWAQRLDLSSIEWLDTAVFPDPPEGSRHALDLVGRMPVATGAATPGLTILLVHVEIESPDRTTALKPRLPYYYHFLRDKFHLPVLPIVIYLKVGLDGIGTDQCIEELWGLEVNRFQYLYVGLPGLEGIEYVQGSSWLGVALSALMRVPRERIVWLGAEALRRLAAAPLSDQQRFLLSECVQAYLPLEETQRVELEQVIQTDAYAGVQAMNQTVYEKGVEKGIEKGIERGLEKGRLEGRAEGRHDERLDLVISLLEERFGPLTETSRASLAKLSMDELRRLALKVVGVSSLAELGLPS